MLVSLRPAFLLGLGFALVPFAACTDDDPSPPNGAVDAGGLDAPKADVSSGTDTGPGTQDASDALVDSSSDAVADSSADAATDSSTDALADGADAADADTLPANALRGIAVVAGERWSLVIAPNRSLYAFGQYINPANGHYQNGGTYANTPVVVQGVDSVKEVVGYGTAFFALKTDGTVWGWGHINSYGAFGQGKDAAAGGVVTQNAPVQILTAAATPITNVCQLVATPHGVVMSRSAEGSGACSAGGARTVWYTGDSLTGTESGLVAGLYAKSFAPLQPGSASNVTGDVSVDRLFASSYSASSCSIFARLTDGRVFAWGYNLNGQLGLGDQTFRSAPTAAAAWNNAVGIASSSEVTVAITPSGSLIASGSAYGGTLGNGTQGSTFQTTPAAVSTLTQVTRLSVATSFSGALAIENGGLFFWGTSGHFGAAATSPRTVPSTNGPFTEAGIGTEHALAINAGGGVYSFGSNQMGELGCGTCVPRIEPTLVTVP